MKITIETNDLTKFIDGLNNAIIAYGEDISAREFCCHSSEKLSKIPLDKAYERFNELKFIYNQLLTIEKEGIE